ncbi:MAG: hypothetical protein B0A82_04640 [Alkalinema sp. CACIAM 70d]|nr:MAG: hypothetical protein B0A82_04640 [Alkalinema sp. CACIAM 70d]
MLQRPLICTNLNDGLQRLTQFLPSLAANGAQQITFLHSIPVSDEGAIARVDSDRQDQARDRLMANMAHCDGLDVQVRVEVGRVVDNVLRVVRERQCDGVMLGTASKSLLTEKLFGSTTRELAQKLTTPILAIRPPLFLTFTAEELDLRCRHLYRTVLVPFDGSESAKYAVEQIQALASQTPSIERCILCWVIAEGGRLTPAPETQIEQAQTTLTTIAAQLQALNIQPIQVIRQGEPATTLLEVAQTYDVSAIAIASNTLGKLLEWSVPSLAAELLRRSWHPVLFLPRR